MQRNPACVNALERMGEELPPIGPCLSGPFDNYAPGMPRWGQLA
jgi:hypothetical protein